LGLAGQSEDIYKRFFLTGGTAISEFYLHHRLSEDLDFFSEDDFPVDICDRYIEKLKNKYRASIQQKRRTGFYRYTLSGEFGELKIDFVYHVFKQLEFGKKIGKLKIASIWDILVDKLYTIFHRGTARDFVDLYLGIKYVDCDWDQLISAMEEKYQSGFDRMSLLSRLPIVKDLADYPKMLVPFDPKKMENFYFDMIKSQEKKIFK